MRCIIGMTIVKFIKNELKFLGGNLQNCFGQRCGSVQAFHSLSEDFEQPETQAIRLIDAKNALKLEQRLSLKNTEVLCPFLHLALPYSQKTPSNLYVSHKVLQSQNGTTQGNPLAMARYGLSICPPPLENVSNNLIQKWYTDDENTTGSVEALKVVLSKLKLKRKYQIKSTPSHRLQILTTMWNTPIQIHYPIKAPSTNEKTHLQYVDRSWRHVSHGSSGLDANEWTCIRTPF